MIEINFVDSPDQEILGKHKFYFNKVRLGREGSASIHINDPELKAVHISLEIKKNEIEISCQDSATYYATNLMYSGVNLHQIDEEIIIGKTKFIITQIESTNPSPSMKEKYDTLTKENPKLSTILNALENELLQIKKAEDVSK